VLHDFALFAWEKEEFPTHALTRKIALNAEVWTTFEAQAMFREGAMMETKPGQPSDLTDDKTDVAGQSSEDLASDGDKGADVTRTKQRATKRQKRNRRKAKFDASNFRYVTKNVDVLGLSFLVCCFCVLLVVFMHDDC